MTVFILICQFVILILLLSMIYSQAQLGREYREKIRNLSQNLISMDKVIQKLERQIVELKEKEVSKE